MGLKSSLKPGIKKLKRKISRSSADDEGSSSGRSSDSDDEDEVEGRRHSSLAAATSRSKSSQRLPSKIMAINSDAGKLANDPTYAVEMAIGDPFPILVPQDKYDTETNIRLTGVYYDMNKRFLFKKAHFSHEDRRVFDVDTGEVILVSHHEGKNPYDSIDLLGYNECATGEWKSKTTVSSVSDPQFLGFKIRPKKLSRHGTQYVDLIGDDKEEVFNVAKMSKFKSKSARPYFVVGRGKQAGKGDKMVYIIEGDIIGRTLSIKNAKNQEVVAVMAKTKTALLKTAAYGGGSESTIDVAPGVDCSTILAIVFAIGQVGVHYVKDAFNNYVIDPIQDAVVETALGEATGGAIGDDGAMEELINDVGMGDEYDAVQDGLKEHAGDVGEQLEEWGEDLGVTDFVEDVGDQVGEWAGDVGDAFEEHGGDIMEGAMDAVGDAIGFFFDMFGDD